MYINTSLHSGYNIYVLVEGAGYLTALDLDGLYLGDIYDALDLVSEWREPITVKGWVNVYSVISMDKNGYISDIHETKEIADELSHPSRIACVYLEGKEDK